MTSDSEIKEFDFIKYIEKIWQGMVHLYIAGRKYPAVRIHGFDYNQPIRITFPDYSPPNIITVLQIMDNEITEEDIRHKDLVLEF